MNSLVFRSLSVASFAFLCACATTRDAQNVADTDKSTTILPSGRFSAPTAGETIVELDTNGDGRPDVVQFWTASPPNTAASDQSPPVLLRKEADLNFDEKVDVWNQYGSDGQLVRQAFDLDFDGRPDVIAHYEKGVIVKKELFQAFSDRPNTFKYYERGKLARVERDTNGDGRIDTWEYWDGQQIDRVGQDLDGDGNVDKWMKPKAESLSSAP